MKIDELDLYCVIVVLSEKMKVVDDNVSKKKDELLLYIFWMLSFIVLISEEV